LTKFKASKAVGIESNADRIGEAKAKVATGALAGKAEFRKGDITALTSSDLAEATVVTIDRAHGSQLAKLAPILKALKPGTRIVVHEFQLPGMKFEDQRELTVDQLDHLIYLYILK
jgi:predicted O-methyltransferase YrrM